MLSGMVGLIPKRAVFEVSILDQCCSTHTQINTNSTHIRIRPDRFLPTAHLAISQFALSSTGNGGGEMSFNPASHSTPEHVRFHYCATRLCGVHHSTETTMPSASGARYLYRSCLSLWQSPQGRKCDLTFFFELDTTLSLVSMRHVSCGCRLLPRRVGFAGELAHRPTFVTVSVRSSIR